MRVLYYIAPIIFIILFSCHKHIESERLDSFSMNWYSEHLEAMKEPTIDDFKAYSKEAYRFIWLRTNHFPVTVRVEIASGNSGMLFLKVTDGSGGHEPGELKIEKEVNISEKQIKELRTEFSKSNFFHTKSTENSFGLDGAQWYFEAHVNGKYHWVDRWSPEGTEFEALGLYFLKLADYKPSTIY